MNRRPRPARTALALALMLALLPATAFAAPTTPSVDISMTPSTNLQPGLPVTLTAKVSNANGAITYKWMDANGVSLGNSQSVTVTPTAGTLSIICAVTNTEGGASVTTAVRADLTVASIGGPGAPVQTPQPTHIPVITPAPTLAPTVAPVVTPTLAPTVSPTAAPTVTPTIAPTPTGPVATPGGDHVHSFGSWTVTKKASCEADGARERTCSLCGEKQTETIPALGHQMSAWIAVKAATETEPGREVRSCERKIDGKYVDTYEESREIPALSAVPTAPAVIATPEPLTQAIPVPAAPAAVEDTDRPPAPQLPIPETSTRNGNLTRIALIGVGALCLLGAAAGIAVTLVKNKNGR